MSGKASLPCLLIIAGPTASGKSGLAIKAAERLNGLVINADSMQVYRELRVITARPGQEDEFRVPHRLYGMLSVKESCSAGRWREMAVKEIEIAWNDGRLPVLVGGTGLYFKVLLQGISKIPDISADIRDETRALHDRIGPKAFHAELAKVDIETAKRLSEADTQRLTRAYEVYLATGVSLSEWYLCDAQIQPIKADVQSLVFQPPRQELYAACDGRFEAMLGMGVLDEVRNLMDMHLDPSLPAMKALGVPELVSYLRGEVSLARATDNVKRATRNYAKRQTTWFRNQFGKSEPIFAQYSESLLEEIFSKIRF